MKLFYFTATGNNLYVVKRIGGEYYSIPKLLKEGRFEFEVEGFLELSIDKYRHTYIKRPILVFF